MVRVIGLFGPHRILMYLIARLFKKAITKNKTNIDRSKLMWSTTTPLKVHCFVWLLLLDRVVVKDSLC